MTASFDGQHIFRCWHEARVSQRSRSRQRKRGSGPTISIEFTLALVAGPTILVEFTMAFSSRPDDLDRVSNGPSNRPRISYSRRGPTISIELLMRVY